MREFLAMGGYGAFVWAAYGFTFLVLAGLAVASVRAARRRAAEVDELRRSRGSATAPTPAKARVARRADEEASPPG